MNPSIPNAMKKRIAKVEAMEEKKEKEKKLVPDMFWSYAFVACWLRIKER
jgi:hypothetical protein